MNFVSSAEVIKVVVHSPNVREFVLKVEKIKKYRPGSFVQLTLDIVTASDIWPESRTFSIASYEYSIVKLIIKKSGVYTSRIFDELHEGKRCTIKYPFGELFDVKIANEKHLFLASGTGVTPFLSLISYFSQSDLIDNICLLYSVKKVADILYRDEISKVLKTNVEFFVTQEVSTRFHNRRIELSDIKRFSEKEANIYICGNKDFNNSFRKMLLEQDYKKIHMDEWE